MTSGAAASGPTAAKSAFPAAVPGAEPAMTARAGHTAPSPRVLTALGWTIAVLASAFIAFCTAVGPIYRADGSIVDFNAGNVMRLAVTFAVCMGVIAALTLWRPKGQAQGQTQPCAGPQAHEADGTPRLSPADRARRNEDAAGQPHRTFSNLPRRIAMPITRATDRWWRIALILLALWAWVPLSLGSAYGYDVTAQIREFAAWWAQSTGSSPAPDYHAAFTQMDVYPIAHYLWPADPTWLTNQHNVALTLFYGGVVHWLGVDRGLMALSAMQFLFAVFVTAVTADRFFQPAGMKSVTAASSTLAGTARNPAGSVGTESGNIPASAVARVATLAFLAINPLIWSATISLTKSPLFALGFLWSFGLWYQLTRTGTLPRHAQAALAASSLVMLASAKYGVYVVLAMAALGLIAMRRHWRLFAVTLLVPVVAFQGALTVASSSGAIMAGDPIEGKSLQIQQIARIAQRDPNAIPAQARADLERIFDLEGMASVYFPDDADPVKSSGGESKTTSYRWRTVSADDMAAFNGAWAATCAASPVVCWDAFAAEFYGYFDVTDEPYVPQIYYVGWPSAHGATTAPGVAAYHAGWRARVVDTVTRWSSTPVVGWLTHGNLWVVLTLLVMCAQAVRRRWKTILVEAPLLLQMAVAAAAPANNFDRHLLGVAFAFAFVAIAYVRDAKGRHQPAPSPLIWKP